MKIRSPPIATTSPISLRICTPPGKTIAAANTDDLRGFIGALAERGFKPASLARRLSAVRQLYRFLYAEGKRGPTIRPPCWKGLSAAARLPKVLSIAEVDALLAQARKEMEDGERRRHGVCARRGC